MYLLMLEQNIFLCYFCTNVHEQLASPVRVHSPSPPQVNRASSPDPASKAMNGGQVKEVYLVVHGKKHSKTWITLFT